MSTISSRGTVTNDNLVWDVNTLDWVKMTQPGSGGGASGDVNVISSVLPAGAATAARQDTGNASVASIDAKITAVNTGAVVVSSSALPSGAATSAKQDSLLTELQLKADLTETQPVSLASVPSHAVTIANLDVALSTRLKPADTLTAVTTVGTITNVVHVDDNAGSLTIDNADITAINSKVPALGQALAASSVPVVLTAIQAAALTPPTTPMADRTAAGTITAVNGTVLIVPASDSTVLATVTGTWVGTLVFLGLDAAGAGIVISCVNASTGAVELITSANGSWLIPSAAWAQVGIFATSWTSGTATVNLISSTGSHLVELSRSLPTGTNSIGQVTANAGTNLNTSLLATSAKQDALLAVMPSTASVDGVTVAFSADWSMRRLQEAQYLQTFVDSMNTMINSESENSQRNGFELR